jgi:hypothetical protein
MIPWITSRSFVLDLNPNWTKTAGENEWAMGRVGVDLGSLTQRLDKLINELNSDQWEIKLIEPLQKGVSYHEHQRVIQAASRRAPETPIGGFGFGWGTQVTSGYVIIAQKTEYLSEVDYTARRQEQKAKPPVLQTHSNTLVTREISDLQAQIDQLRAGDAIQTRKSGLLRGEKFHFAGKDYASYGEAETIRSARIMELEERILNLS